MLILAFSLTLFLSGCGDEQLADIDTVVDKEQTETENPIDTFLMLADLEAAFGHDVADFGDNNIEGYEPEVYAMICGDYTVAEIKYVKGENQMFVRTGDTAAGDISGVHGENLEFADYESNGLAVKYALVENDTYIAYWVDGDYSYSLYETEEMEETYFKVLIDYLTASLAAESEAAAE